MSRLRTQDKKEEGKARWIMVKHMLLVEIKTLKTLTIITISKVKNP